MRIAAGIHRREALSGLCDDAGWHRSPCDAHAMAKECSAELLTTVRPTVDVVKVLLPRLFHWPSVPEERARSNLGALVAPLCRTVLGAASLPAGA
jgi:hypothetical protein